MAFALQAALFIKALFLIQFRKRISTLVVVLATAICITSLFWITMLIQNITSPSNDIPLGLYTFTAKNFGNRQRILLDNNSTFYGAANFTKLLKDRGVDIDASLVRCDKSHCNKISFQDNYDISSPVSISVKFFRNQTNEQVFLTSSNFGENFDLTFSYLQMIAGESMLREQNPNFEVLKDVEIFKYLYSTSTSTSRQVFFKRLNDASIIAYLIFVLLGAMIMSLYNCKTFCEFKENFFLDYLFRSGFRALSCWIPLWSLSFIQSVLVAVATMIAFQLESYDMTSIPANRNLLVFVCSWSLCMYMSNMCYLFTVLLRRFVFITVAMMAVATVFIILFAITALVFVPNPDLQIVRAGLLLLPPVHLPVILINANKGLSSALETYNLAAFVMCIIFPIFIMMGTIYLDNVLSNGNGLKLPMSYIVNKNYWFQRQTRPVYTPQGNILPRANNIQESRPNVEKVTSSLRHSIIIDKISKHYNTSRFCSSYSVVNAVNDFTATVYEDQITCLIGHNGAGKTSLINVLIGKENTTSGKAVVNDVQITDPFERLCLQRQVGVCEQFDILCPVLTAEENIALTLAARNQSLQERNYEVNNLLGRLGIKTKTTTLADKLSGGHKRKLCTVMALVGHPTVVFLDEPTSGLDPVSRRELWQVLQEYKKDRSIILSTHFMDEADILADRKIFMTAGKLICAGSSLFLKHAFGCGAMLNISTESENASNLILKHLVELCPTIQPKQVDKTELQVSVPMASTQYLPVLVQALEENKQWVQSFGLSQTTLDEIFLRIRDLDIANIEQLFEQKALGNNTSFDSKLSTQIQIPKQNNDDVAQASFPKQFAAQLQMNTMRLRRKKLKLCCRFIFPVLLLGLLVGGLYLDSQVGLNFIPSAIEYVPTGVLYYKTDICIGEDTDAVFNNTDLSYCGVKIAKTSNMSIYNFISTEKDVLLNKSDKTCGPNVGQRYKICTLMYLTSWNSSQRSSNKGIFGYLKASAGWSLSEQFLLADSALQYLLSLDNLFPFRNLKDFAYFPYPFQFYLSFALYVLVILMSILPVTYLSDPIEDKQSKVRSQLVAMGMSTTTYWLNTLLLHWCQYGLFFLLAYIIFIFANATSSTFGNLTFIIIVFLPVLFIGLPAVLMFCYFLGSLFKKPQTGITILMFFIQIVLAFSIPGIMTSAGFILVTVWVWPPFTPLLYLFCVAKFRNIAVKFNVDVSPDSVEYIPYLLSDAFCLHAFLAMFVHLILFSFLLYFSDNFQIFKAILIGFFKNAKVAGDSFTEEGVKAENKRDKSQDLLTVTNLYKIYPNGFHAVKNLTFGVKPQEIVALLGPNGAGKSTTLSIIVGEEQSSNGSTKVVHNKQLLSGSEAAKKGAVGYCPQFNPLFDDITVKEHLTFYAKIRGIPNNKVGQQTNALIQNLSLTEHSNKPASQLSGGNKRRLCLAIGLLGNPSAVVIDEASTGVDPETKRSIWAAIRDMKSDHRAVVVTTHSMEEVEALATRVGIMNQGEMIAFGSTQQLKSRYGQSYTLEILIAVALNDDEKSVANKKAALITAFTHQFPNMSLSDSLFSRLQINIPTKEIKSLSSTLKWINENADELHIQYFSFYQASLDQIFVTLIRNHLAQMDADEIISSDL